MICFCAVTSAALIEETATSTPEPSAALIELASLRVEKRACPVSSLPARRCRCPACRGPWWWRRTCRSRSSPGSPRPGGPDFDNVAGQRLGRIGQGCLIRRDRAAQAVRPVDGRRRRCGLRRSCSTRSRRRGASWPGRRQPRAQPRSEAWSCGCDRNGWRWWRRRRRRSCRLLLGRAAGELRQRLTAERHDADREERAEEDDPERCAQRVCPAPENEQQVSDADDPQAMPWFSFSTGAIRPRTAWRHASGLRAPHRARRRRRREWSPS